MKYVDTLITFSEVPDEVALCLNISNCPCHCPGCHSSYLAQDIGQELTDEVFLSLVQRNRGISCVCLMGGDAQPERVVELAQLMKTQQADMKVAWYSGRQEMAPVVKENLSVFDYVKVGPYQEAAGPLNNPNTNQIMYEVHHQADGTHSLENITSWFWDHFAAIHL